MLTALEITGFKSFPDKTRFEFPPGITVVVGPNGSGKSNIVDAIKWVLGEQSAKSLRGQDMADVIFKGTRGPGGRKAANTAEATIILDNADRSLRYDAEEIRVTRRVYRSGEGEYLINGDPCRLKDIRNLFRGTGIGTDAYSLIEQGKVDRLLQASPKERRGTFEEAAGISRFKAKKIEAERRLARVEQNLVRLADIVDEVGSRFRSVKSQASKATRYKEYTERLRYLRTYVGHKDWLNFTDRLVQIEQSKSEKEALVQQQQQELGTLETRTKELDQQLSSWSTQIVELQQTVGQLHEQVAQRQSQVSLNESRSEDLQIRSRQQREQLNRSDQRSVEMQQRLRTAEQQHSQAQTGLQAMGQSLSQCERGVAELDQRLDQLRRANESRRQQLGEITTRISELGKQVSAASTQLDSLAENRNRLLTSLNQVDRTLSEQQKKLGEYNREQQRLNATAERKDSDLRGLRKTLNETRRQRDETQAAQAQLGQQRAGATQRVKVLEELEKRLEGIGIGARDLIHRARQQPSGPFSQVVGIVADLVKVNVQHAELVDVALGNLAQYVVVEGDQLIEQIGRQEIKLRGRVGLIPIDAPSCFGASTDVDLHDCMGVVGRLDELVETRPEHAPFVRKLLGGTWLVKTLDIARQLRSTRGRKVRFVTLNGEVLEVDGTMVAGSPTGGAGIVSRRSELRALSREIHEWSAQIQQHQRLIQELDLRAGGLDQQVQSLLGEHTEIAAMLSDQRAKAAAAEQQISGLQTQRSEIDSELKEAEKRLVNLESQLAIDRNTLTEQETQSVQLTQAMERDEARIQQSQQQRELRNSELTSLQVELARCQQKFDNLRAQVAQTGAEWEDLRQAIGALRNELAQSIRQRRRADRAVVEIQAELTSLCDQKATLESQLAQLNAHRAEDEQQRREIAGKLATVRDSIRLALDEIHQLELRENQISLERQQLAERLREDYEIDVSSVADADVQTPQGDRESIDVEIRELRKKITNIGAVNLDALNELDELEQRFTSLSHQHDDLVEAKQALEKIIQRINNDSRRLFVETLEAIRENFQQLFRLTFGGGKAEIVLEEGVDVLDAGIEILATPPGKTQFSNSLLSGGERAMTAVSLLMAIFKFRPSPFCILDEVDAPFDEANIGRFIDVLKSFLGWTKFVIVTHSKKTMTAANTLYGITMQESGVSKRVSVRFEDVSEDGRITPSGADDSDQRVA